MRRARGLDRLPWTTLACVALGLLLTQLAYGAEAGLFDSIVGTTQRTSQDWFTRIRDLVRPTFIILGTLEICWAAALWALERDSLNSLAVEMIKKIMMIGFFMLLLNMAPDWIPRIVGTFESAGTQAAGLGELSTDGIIAQGLALIGRIWADSLAGIVLPLANPLEIMGTTNPTAAVTTAIAMAKLAVTVLVTVGVVIAYVVVAAQYFTLKIESYVLTAAGAVFLGLGSSSWTKEYVSKYLSYAMNVGVRLLVMILTLSLTLHAVNQVGGDFTFDFKPLLSVLAASLLQAILAIKAPEMAGALLSGGIGLSAGSARGAAGTAVGGALGGIGRMVSAVQGASNLAKAVNAGREIAKQKNPQAGGASATVGGLKAAAGATAKALPGKLMDAIKGRKGNPSRGGSGGGGGGTGSGGSSSRGGGSGSSNGASGSSSSSGGGGQNPGVFHLAKRALREQAEEGRNSASEAPTLTRAAQSSASDAATIRVVVPEPESIDAESLASATVADVADGSGSNHERDMVPQDERLRAGAELAVSAAPRRVALPSHEVARRRGTPGGVRPPGDRPSDPR